MNFMEIKAHVTPNMSFIRIGWDKGSYEMNYQFYWNKGPSKQNMNFT